jgi:hypothetical protein
MSAQAKKSPKSSTKVLRAEKTKVQVKPAAPVNQGASNWWLPEEFRVSCAWCGVEMQAPKVLREGPAPESHGICSCCAVRMGMPADRFVSLT